MVDLMTVPEWFGVAVISALLAGLGYVARTLLEFWNGLVEARSRRRARLVELASLLNAAKTIFLVQNERARRLAGAVKDVSEIAQNADGLEEILSAAHSSFEASQHEEHKLIRSYTSKKRTPTLFLTGRFSQPIRLTFGCRRPNAAVRLLSNFQAQCHAALGA